MPGAKNLLLPNKSKSGVALLPLATEGSATIRQDFAVGHFTASKSAKLRALVIDHRAYGACFLPCQLLHIGNGIALPAISSPSSVSSASSSDHARGLAKFVLNHKQMHPVFDKQVNQFVDGQLFGNMDDVLAAFEGLGASARSSAIQIATKDMSGNLIDRVIENRNA